MIRVKRSEIGAGSISIGRGKRNGGLGEENYRERHRIWVSRQLDLLAHGKEGMGLLAEDLQEIAEEVTGTEQGVWMLDAGELQVILAYLEKDRLNIEKWYRELHWRKVCS